MTDIKGMIVPPSPLFRTPICFARAVDLQKEVHTEEYAKSQNIQKANSEASNPQDATLVNLFNKERVCLGFTKWQQGFTPKEHREMLDRERMIEYQTKREDEWQRFQEQMAADDKKWKEEQEAEAEERHQREIRTLQSIHKAQMWVMGVLVTLIIVVTELLGGAIEANWFPRWFGVG